MTCTGPMHDQLEQRVAKTDVKVERLEQEVKRQRNKDVSTGKPTKQPAGYDLR